MRLARRKHLPATKRPRSRLLALLFGTWAVFQAGVASPAPGGNAEDRWPMERLNRVFEQAAEAYNAGEVEQAIALYRQLLERGYYSDALFFNLGNAYFKNGSPGRAILHYRRASYLSPRDPDIEANSQFALESAQAAAPSLPLVEKTARSLGLPVWVALAVCGYWGAALAMGIALHRTSARTWVKRVLIVLAVVLACSITGIVQWVGLYRYPEAVVVGLEQEVLFAPLEGSTPHFSAPEGTVLRVLDDSEARWLKVRHGKKVGWIRRAECELVYPFVSRTS